MSRWWRDMILRENLLSEIHPALDASQGVVIEKTQYDAFYKTDLETHLHEKGVKQVVISGVMTHLCCETTARSAFMRGLDVFFLVDVQSNSKIMQLDRATLRNLSHGFATLALSEEIAQPVSGA